jgi:hypothetical protein
VSKTVEPVFVLKDTAENALIITKEKKRRQAASGYGRSKWFSSTVTRSHGEMTYTLKTQGRKEFEKT